MRLHCRDWLHLVLFILVVGTLVQGSHAAEPEKPRQDTRPRNGVVEGVVDSVASLSKNVDVWSKGESAQDLRMTELILVSTLDGSIRGVHRYTGTVQWTFHGGSSAPLIKTDSALNNGGEKVEREGKNAKISITPPRKDDLFSEDWEEDWEANNDILKTSGEHHESSSKRTDNDEVIYIVEPKGDGTLYIFSQAEGVKKLPLTIKELIANSPFKAPDGTIYVGSKSTRLIAIDPFTGKLLKRYDPEEADYYISSPKDNFDGAIYLGRNEYKLSIFDGATRKRKWNVTYSEYVPNSYDQGTDLPEYPQDLYVGPDASGGIAGISMKTGEVRWAHSFPSPAFNIFSIFLRSDDSVLVHRQPVPNSPFPGLLGKTMSEMDDFSGGASSAYIGTLNGTFYAMSEENFPLVKLSRLAALYTGVPPSMITREQMQMIGDRPWNQDESDQGVDDDALDSDPPKAIKNRITNFCSLSPDSCSLDEQNPLFQKYMEGRHLIEMPTASKLIDGATKPDNQKRPIPPISDSIVIGENAGFWVDGPGRFWKTYILIAVVSIWLLRHNIRAQLDQRIKMHMRHDMDTRVPELQKYWNKVSAIVHRLWMKYGEQTWLRVKVLYRKHNSGQMSNKQMAELDQLWDKNLIKVETGSAPGARKRRKGTKKMNGTEINGIADADRDGDVVKPSEMGKKLVTFDESISLPESSGENSEIQNISTLAPAPGQPVKINSLSITDEVLGYGSHGTVVYRGYFSGREVAVKRLLLDFYDVAFHEVSLLEVSDDHPNVIRYFCKEQNDRFLYIALELCLGSISDVFEYSTQPSKASLLEGVDPARILFQIMYGINHLHSLKIVHRDIKPQNILIAPARANYKAYKGTYSNNARILISDFGLCKKLEADQSSFYNTTATAAGTIGWRAPELLTQTASETSDDRSLDSHGDNRGNTSQGNSSSNPSSSATFRVTKAIDIFSAGCVFYYILSSGEHPFGDRFSREMNILRGEYSLAKLDSMGEEGYEARDLIERMLSHEPKERPNADSILTHPFFWTPAQRLSFLQDASDRFEIEPRDPPSPLIEDLEYRAEEVIGQDWYKRIDRLLVNDLSKFRKYNGKKIRDLLRAMRNKRHHFQDLPEPLRRSLGEPPDGFLYYFTSRFPKLFLHTYFVISEDPNVRQEPLFRHYFDIPDVY